MCIFHHHQQLILSLLREPSALNLRNLGYPAYDLYEKKTDFLVARKEELGYLPDSVFPGLLSQCISVKYLTRNTRNNKTLGRQGRF